MPHCIHHTDRETRYHCGKHNIYLCEECLTCRDPELFCKFRSACPIWFMSRKQKHLADRATDIPVQDDMPAVQSGN